MRAPCVERARVGYKEDSKPAERKTALLDGDFPRRSYHSYFYARLGDVTPDWTPENEAQGHGRAAQPRAVITANYAASTNGLAKRMAR